MKTPKTPDKLSSSHFSKFLPEYVEYAERIRKTLYYGKLPTTDRPSLPFTSISVEKFSELCRQDGLERLDLRYASSVCYDACITPCSLILALVYLERLRCNNPEYLATASPSQIFLVAVMVASKYLYDDGEEDEVFNDEWATSAALPLSDLNKAEKEFLVAIDWNLFVDADAFLKAFEQVEGEVAWREGERRGYFTYTDLMSLGRTLPGSCTAVLNLMSHVFAVCMVGYTAAILSAVAGTLLAQECSQQISTALHQWTSDLVTTSETSSACPNTTDLLTNQESLTQSVNMLPGEIENAEEVGNGKVNLTGLPSHALTTLTTSILLAISSPGRTRHQIHQQYLTKPDDCHEFDLSRGEAVWKKQKSKTFDTFDEPDDLDFDPADLRLTFTTGSYWPPSSMSKRFAHDNVILSKLPNLDLHNSDAGNHDQKGDGIYSSLWMYPRPSYQDLSIYNTISNFSGIGAPNLHEHIRGGDIVDTSMASKRIPCEVKAETSLSAEGYDGIVLVTDTLSKLASGFEALAAPLKSQAEFDASVEKDGACVKVNLPANRLIFAPTGPLNRDYDDVRRFADAALSGIKRAVKVGVKRPLLVRAPDQSFKHADLVTLLGALHALYVPLEIREDLPEKITKVQCLGFLGDAKTVQLALALESGRSVARDIGGSDPERMAPPRVEEYVRKVFEGTKVKIDVVSEDAKLVKDYPLFSAVNRCAKGVPRHQGRIIYLTYEGAGPIEQTLMLVGKGVTYDTGGADIKAGGVMAGMHRDKCGSAAVAGFMQILAKLQPANIKVIGSMAMVRNSVGSECYVADEIITSRAGVRVRVGNTDAEGRMAMADVLCHMKEMAVNEVNPYLMTIATLTGHCVLAYGEAYTAIIDNGSARLAGLSQKLQASGEEVADPFEISSMRREDFDFHCGKSEYEDVLQCNNAPSSRTPRGHQTPSAFLVMSSGMDKHGKESSKPLKYSHLDIAGSSGPFPGIPTGAPILAMAHAFIPSAF